MNAGARKVQPQLLAVDAPLTRDSATDALAYDHHAAHGAPAVQLQLGFYHLAALVVRPAPVLARELLGHQALHVLGLPQPQQVRLPAAFQRQKDAFVAVTRIAAYQRRPALTQFVQQLAQRGLGMHAGVLFA